MVRGTAFAGPMGSRLVSDNWIFRAMTKVVVEISAQVTKVLKARTTICSVEETPQVKNATKPGISVEKSAAMIDRRIAVAPMKDWTDNC
jgi:hypothetical protein